MGCGTPVRRGRSIYPYPSYAVRLPGVVTSVTSCNQEVVRAALARNRLIFMTF